MKKETQLDVLKDIREAQNLLNKQLNALLDNRALSISPAVSLPVETRTIHIPKGLTIETALAECKSFFSVWRYTEKNLDELVTSDRTSENAYSITFKNCIEADEEYANKSANDLKGLKTITLLERIVMELDYFKETGQHLDLKNWTLCAGSRFAGATRTCVLAWLFPDPFYFMTTSPSRVRGIRVSNFCRNNIIHLGS